MPSFRHDGRPPGRTPAPFHLYVEGPRDRDLLATWARRTTPRVAAALARATVILGGCQPARAVEHLLAARGARPELRGLCVLDRDDGTAEPHAGHETPGLEFFTWGRRHIESYLLVPDAIRRALGLRDDDTRVTRFFRDHLPPAHDESALGRVDAKRLFAERGPLARALGRRVAPGRVARAMRADELHAEIHGLLGRVRSGLGADGVEVACVRRRR